MSVLPFSLYTYVEACRSQKREDLIGCLNNMMRFYGGVAKAVVSSGSFIIASNGTADCGRAYVYRVPAGLVLSAFMRVRYHVKDY